MKNWLHHLNTAWNRNTLPAWDSQKKMSPSGTKEYLKIPKETKKAGVLALLYPEGEELHICFIKRSSRIKEDKHAGQIGFPGGKLEDSDKDMLDCATRETMEEIGVDKSQYIIIGELSPIYVYVSNFMVYPFVAFTKSKPVFTKQEAEVQDVLSIPLALLQNKDNQKLMDLPIREMILPNVPYFDLNGEILWGATAMMTQELLDILEQK